MLLVGEPDEAILLVECACLIVFGINNNGPGTNVRTLSKGTPQRVIEQMPAEATPLIREVDGESPEEDRWDKRVSREFPRCTQREIAALHRERAQGIESCHSLFVGINEHEHRRHIAANVLTCLGSEIAIKRVRTAGELAAIVVGLQGLDSESRIKHRLPTKPFEIPLGGLPQFCVRLGRVHDRLDEELAIPLRQGHCLVPLN